MTREQRKIETAVKHLRREYEAAVENKYVNDPLAYALYHTWKHYDEVREKRRRRRQ